MHSFKMYHRDLRLDNLWLDEDYKLLLFDSVVSARTSSINSDKTLIALDPYKAPEIFQTLNEKQKNSSQLETIDLFALGVILFELYFGWPPFDWATKLDRNQ